MTTSTRIFSVLGISLSLALVGCGSATLTLPEKDGGMRTPTDDGGVIEPVDSGEPLSDARELTGLVFTDAKNPSLGADVTGTLTGTAIAVTVPFTASVAGLIPTLSFVGASISPASDTAQDFSSPVTYTVTADDGETISYVVTVTKAPPTCMGQSATACSLDVYNRAVAYAAAHPTRADGSSWDGWCGALMMQFGGFASSAPSAISAYHASTIVSTDPTTAPIGAFHYWNYTSAGHVGVDLLGQGAVVFMASAHLGDSWNPYIGVNSVGGYEAATGAPYLGWSLTYNGHGQQLSGGGACGAANAPNGCELPKTPTATSGVPDQAFVMLMQRYGADHGYTGPNDGHSNAATWAGVQRGLQAYGYTGPIDGLPASHTYLAFQKLAAMFGYTGPQNGVLGPNSYRGFAKFLNATY